MPKYAVGIRDARVMDIFVDGERRKYAFYADTDEGFICEYVVEPPDEQGRCNIKRNAIGQPIVDTIWGKVEIKPKGG